MECYTQGDWRQELNRFHRAQQIAIQELNTLYHRALNQVGEGVASIFSIHGMLLEDHDYIETVRMLIQGQAVTAEYAVEMAEVSFYPEGQLGQPHRHVGSGLSHPRDCRGRFDSQMGGTSGPDGRLYWKHLH